MQCIYACEVSFLIQAPFEPGKRQSEFSLLTLSFGSFEPLILMVYKSDNVIHYILYVKVKLLIGIW